MIAPPVLVQEEKEEEEEEEEGKKGWGAAAPPSSLLWAERVMDVAVCFIVDGKQGWVLEERRQKGRTRGGFL